MTFNTGLDLSNSEQIRKVILKENADVVALQEVSPALGQLLREDVAKSYPYQVIDTPNETTVLLSRYPLRASDWLRSQDQERATLHAKIEWNGDILQVFAVHPLPADVTFYSSEFPIPLGLDDLQQQQQIRTIKNVAESLSGEKLILGDFNMSERASVYTELTESFRMLIAKQVGD